jgi:hypothetical protein
VKRRAGFFYGWWFDPATGRRLQRATRSELASAYKVWATHADIRCGRAKEMRR